MNFFVPLIVSFLQLFARRDKLVNDPFLHSLASGVFNSWRSSNRSPVLWSRTALLSIMSDMNFSSSSDRFSVTFSFLETISLGML